jgi:acetyl esterase
MLHPQAKALLRLIEEKGVPATHTLTPAQARAFYRERRTFTQPDAPEVASVQDLQATGPAGAIPVRSYRPAGSSAAAMLPVLVYYHGGGWVIGDLDTHDVLCRQIALGARCAVFSVDYRLGPESPFPAAVDDCLSCTRYVIANAKALQVDAARVAVGGDSAGGNLAAVVCLLAREAGPVIDAQVLLYPALDLTFTRPSVERFATGPVLTRADMEVFRTHYLGEDGDPTDPLCSPLFAPDVADLPPALVVTAAVDPLHDDGADYVARLGAAGVPVKHTDHARAVHGFLSFPGVCRASAAALDDVCAELTVRLA